MHSLGSIHIVGVKLWPLWVRLHNVCRKWECARRGGGGLNHVTRCLGCWWEPFRHRDLGLHSYPGSGPFGGGAEGWRRFNYYTHLKGYAFCRMFVEHKYSTTVYDVRWDELRIRMRNTWYKRPLQQNSCVCQSKPCSIFPIPPSSYPFNPPPLPHQSLSSVLYHLCSTLSFPIPPLLSSHVPLPLLPPHLHSFYSSYCLSFSYLSLPS